MTRCIKCRLIRWFETNWNELKVRGITDQGNVETLRKHFRSIVALEKSGGPLQGKVNLDGASEVTECEKKVSELRELISSFAGSANQVQKMRLSLLI